MDILSFLFPTRCLECKRGGKYLCSSCIGKVLDGTFDKYNFSIFKYSGVVKKAITAIKYKFATDIADELVENCIKRLRSLKFHNVTLVPIPLHWHKQKWRGFNQSDVLGKMIAKQMNWEYLPDLLIRTKQTKPQAELRKMERKTNLSNVFALNQQYKMTKNQNYFLNKKILLFDDVYTTGSTIKEASECLQKEGFKNIYSLTIAR